MSAKKLTPDNCPVEVLEDHVLVQRHVVTSTGGGILLPDKDDPKSRQLTSGSVIAVGPGRQLDDGSFKFSAVKPGDTIFFSVQAKIDLGVEFEKFFIEKGFDKENMGNIVIIGHGNIVFKAK